MSKDTSPNALALAHRQALNRQDTKGERRAARLLLKSLKGTKHIARSVSGDVTRRVFALIKARSIEGSWLSSFEVSQALNLPSGHPNRPRVKNALQLGYRRGTLERRHCDPTRAWAPRGLSSPPTEYTRPGWVPIRCYVWHWRADVFMSPAEVRARESVWCL